MQSRSQSFVPLYQRLEKESSGSIRFEITIGNNRILVIWFTAQSQTASMACYGACLKWMLPELSFSDRWSRGTKLWERDWNQWNLSDLTLSMRRVTGRPWIADFPRWKTVVLEPMEPARGRDSWSWPKGTRPLGTSLMLISLSWCGLTDLSDNCWQHVSMLRWEPALFAAEYGLMLFLRR